MCVCVRARAHACMRASVSVCVCGGGGGGLVHERQHIQTGTNRKLIAKPPKLRDLLRLSVFEQDEQIVSNAQFRVFSIHILFLVSSFITVFSSIASFICL